MTICSFAFPFDYSLISRLSDCHAAIKASIKNGGQECAIYDVFDLFTGHVKYQSQKSIVEKTNPPIVVTTKKTIEVSLNPIFHERKRNIGIKIVNAVAIIIFVIPIPPGLDPQSWWPRKPYACWQISGQRPLATHRANPYRHRQRLQCHRSAIHCRRLLKGCLKIWKSLLRLPTMHRHD